MKYFLILIFMVVTFSTRSVWATSQNSAFILEPSIGYRNENIKLTDYSSNETQTKISAPVYGLKIGVRSLIGIDLNLAGDYSSGKAELSPLAEKNNFSHQTASVQLGVSALGLMKIYLGYAFLNELKLDDGSLNKGFKLSGPAYLAGLQIKLFPIVNLGLQYNLNQFKSIQGSQFTNGDAIDTYYNKIDTQDYSAYLSFNF